MLIIILAFLCLLPCFAMADVCPDGYFIYYIDWDKYDCRIYCNAGTYLANTYDNKCSIVGPGYWAPKSSIKYGGVGVRYSCASGLTTIGYGTGADQAEDCGRVLHVGDSQLYLRSVRNTTPSLHISVDDKVFYGNMTYVDIEVSESAQNKLRIIHDEVLYSVYDDSLSLEVQKRSTKFDYADYEIVDGNIVSINPDVYLQSSDSQYINTGLYGDTRYKYEIVYQQTEGLRTALWGMRNQPLFDKGPIFAYTWTNSQSIGGDTAMYVTTAAQKMWFKTANNLKKHTFYMDGANSTVTLDNTTNKFSVSEDFISDYELFLFTNNVAGTAATSAAVKIYSYKVWDENDVLIQHFVPVAINMEIGDFVVPENGMWDIVNRTFYPNSGDGFFTYSKDNI